MDDERCCGSAHVGLDVAAQAELADIASDTGLAGLTIPDPVGRSGPHGSEADFEHRLQSTSVHRVQQRRRGMTNVQHAGGRGGFELLILVAR